jgi:hypothetical protein
MLGAAFMARAITASAIPDAYGNRWQYHSRSDRHSKIACCGIVLDLLTHCPLLRTHAAAGKIGFGINHPMQDFQTNRRKVLDLVICTPGNERRTKAPGSGKAHARSFGSLIRQYESSLIEEEERLLAELPELLIVPVGSVSLALEAKASMTAHIKALPRLHDELDSSHLTVHGHADSAIAAALVMINASAEFISSDKNKRPITAATATWSVEPQPRSAERTIAKVREIRRRSKAHDQGFDAVGIVLVDFKNDGSKCLLHDTTPAPEPDELDHYENLIRRISSLYATKFAAY